MTQSMPDDLRREFAKMATQFECADCGHPTRLMSGTLLEKTHPLRMWFRAIFEISTRRTEISAKDV